MQRGVAMTTKHPVEGVAQWIDRQVAADELRAALTVPLSDEEREAILELGDGSAGAIPRRWSV
jgi:hypothetical protein